jgi:hypothetical protein
MDRLTNFATKLIDPRQTAFIKGRYIVDGAVTLHEIVHELKRKKLKGVILKIDFEKAYDSIRWDFVEEVLEKKGFDNKLKEWIMSPVRGAECALILMGRMDPTLEPTEGCDRGILFRRSFLT